MGNIQTNCASPKQPTIFQKPEAVLYPQEMVLLGEICKEKLTQNYKNISLGLKAPKDTTEGIYIDKKCPFNDNVFIQARILSGVLTRQIKMQRTVVIHSGHLYYDQSTVVAQTGVCAPVPLNKRVSFSVL
uniref:40S ribosomal protein S11-like n=1 Tax=Arvicanthis niloticus TaxID=61156 RepID=UPI001486CD75|nr:40S ribosomal protein S11-like [Arvicanthis niloticus]